MLEGKKQLPHSCNGCHYPQRIFHTLKNRLQMAQDKYRWNLEIERDRGPPFDNLTPLRSFETWTSICFASPELAQASKKKSAADRVGGEMSTMGAAVRAAAADAAVTFLWVLCASGLGAATAAVTSYLSLQEQYSALLVTASLLFVLLSAFNPLCEALGGARFSPTDVAAFYAAGLSQPSLFSIALRLPAQAAGAVGGALAISRLMPAQYKHTLEGPSLKVDPHTGAVAEGVLTFTITFLVLCIVLKGPRNPVVKTWMLSVTTVCLVLTGAGYTGPSMNPANAFGWAYINNRHNTWEQFYVYWICPFIGAVLAASIFRVLFLQPEPKPKAKKA